MHSENKHAALASVRYLFDFFSYKNHSQSIKL